MNNLENFKDVEDCIHLKACRRLSKISGCKNRCCNISCTAYVSIKKDIINIFDELIGNCPVYNNCGNGDYMAEEELINAKNKIIKYIENLESE